MKRLAILTIASSIFMIVMSPGAFAGGCYKDRLISMGQLDSDIQPATIQFTSSRMVITQNAGTNQVIQKSTYEALGESVRYKVVEATANGSPTPIVNPGPHTVPCNVVGDLMLEFGNGTWSSF